MNDYLMIIGSGQAPEIGFGAVALVFGAVLSAAGFVVGADRWLEARGTIRAGTDRPRGLSDVDWPKSTTTHPAACSGCPAR